MVGLLQNPICQFFIKLIRAIPVFIVLTIVGFCYYVYCFQTIAGLTDVFLLRAVIYIVFHILLLLFLYSYFVTVFTVTPEIPSKFYLPEAVVGDFYAEKSEQGRNDILFRFVSQNKLMVLNVSVSEGPRFCSTCKCIKPDRSHHCSICSTCVLRYDHHCPWVNNCVHNENYKAFMLFLFYGLVLCTFVLATSISSLVHFLKGNRLQYEVINNFGSLFLPFLTFLFGISMACLFFYHVYLVCSNRTTIEQWNPPHFEHGPDKNAYNVGYKRNFKQIFGESMLFWLLPIRNTACNGVTYCLRRKGFFHEQLCLLDDHSSDEEDIGSGRSLMV